MSVLLHPNDEAVRIWRSVPQSDWRKVLSELPVKAVFNRVEWPYRIAVQERLRIAWNSKDSGIVVIGMTAKEFGCDLLSTGDRNA